MKIKECIILGTSLLIFNGCFGTTDSDNIKTKGIYADYQLTLSDDGTTYVRASLMSGNKHGATLDLTNGDTLSVEVDGNSEKLERFSLLQNISYSRKIMTNVADTKVTILFTRTTPQQELKSSILLPEKFELLTPKENMITSLNDILHITWSPSSENTNMEIGIETICDTGEVENSTKTFSNNISNLNDNGSYDYLFSSNYKEDLEKYSNCKTSLEVTRFRLGIIDSSFDDGEIKASYSKSINLDIQ